MKNNIFIICFFSIFFLFSYVFANEKALVRLKDKTDFIVDLAVSDEEKKRGLMYIDRLVNTNGMLFLNKRSQSYSWLGHENKSPAYDVVASLSLL